MKKSLILGSLVVIMMAMSNGLEAKKFETAIFAGGCFWCMEPPYAQLDGVKSVAPGYSGGEIKNPSYEQVSSGRTKHLEVIQVTYNPKKVSYDELLDVFWRSIDPTDEGGQFADRGRQYETAIFYNDEEQKKIAEQSKARLAASGKFSRPIVTEIRPAGEFYEAEKYHQKYYLKNPGHYKSYKEGSGRAPFLRQTWGEQKKPKKTSDRKYTKPSSAELKKKLDALQYTVTQEEGTEPPFRNTYWDNKQAGIYVDVVSGEPLFSSLDKFKSGTGWPSFTRPLEPENIADRTDRKLALERTEVRSKRADSHLGHVFDDGPAPTGKRFCINSAALRFIPVEDLEKEGYGEYSNLFKSGTKAGSASK